MYTIQSSIPSSENSADRDYLASGKIGNLFSSILIIQCSHRLVKHLNCEGFLEKSLKIK